MDEFISTESQDGGIQISQLNSCELDCNVQVDDLFTDLADGRKLLKLLEIISGEKLGKPNSGKMRVHRVENVNRSLAFLHTKVSYCSCGWQTLSFDISMNIGYFSKS